VLLCLSRGRNSMPVFIRIAQATYHSSSLNPYQFFMCCFVSHKQCTTAQVSSPSPSAMRCFVLHKQLKSFPSPGTSHTGHSAIVVYMSRIYHMGEPGSWMGQTLAVPHSPLTPNPTRPLHNAYNLTPYLLLQAQQPCFQREFL